MRKHIRSTFLRGWIVLAFLAVSQGGFAQVSGTDPLLEPTELEARIKGLADTPEGDEGGRKALADFRDALRFSNTSVQLKSL